MRLKRSTTGRGFSLLELIVVILVLGILAGVAAPRLFDANGTAIDSSLKQTLAVVRDSIELFAARNNGALPGADGSETSFKRDLAPFVRGSFPVCPVGAKNDRVLMTGGLGVLTTLLPSTHAWQYNYETGEFIVNFNDRSITDINIRYEDL